MIKLEKPLIIELNGTKREIKEIDITKENFTAKVILDAEQEFLMEGGVFPNGSMESSRSYLAFILAKILNVRVESVKALPGEEFIKATNEVRSFFGGSVYDQLAAKILEK